MATYESGIPVGKIVIEEFTVVVRGSGSIASFKLRNLGQDTIITIRLVSRSNVDRVVFERTHPIRRGEAISRDVNIAEIPRSVRLEVESVGGGSWSTEYVVSTAVACISVTADVGSVTYHNKCDVGVEFYRYVTVESDGRVIDEASGKLFVDRHSSLKDPDVAPPAGSTVRVRICDALDRTNCTEYTMNIEPVEVTGLRSIKPEYVIGAVLALLILILLLRD